MIDPRRAQLSFGDRLIAEEVDGLYEEWMIHADEVLTDGGIATPTARAAQAMALGQSFIGGHHHSLAPARAEEALVPQRPEMANGV